MRRDGKNATMIEHVVRAADLEKNRKIVVVREENLHQFATALDPEFYSLVTINDTRGQAETVYKGALHLINGEPAIVMNCDNRIHYPLNLFAAQSGGLHSALVFPGEGDTAYSYVRNFPLFEDAAEKLPIGLWAMAGAYYFPNSLDLLYSLEKLLRSEHNTHAGEFYLSGVFQELVKMTSRKNLAVAMPRDYLTSWGTPEDLARDRYSDGMDDPEIEKILEGYR